MVEKFVVVKVLLHKIRLATRPTPPHAKLHFLMWVRQPRLLKGVRALVSISQTPQNSKIYRIEMGHAPVNSFNLALASKTLEAVLEVNKSDAEGVILSSSCRVFSAGLDLTLLFGASEDSLRSFWRVMQEVAFTMYSSDKFYVAEIGGHAPAAGTILASCCDVRIMLKGSKIGLNEAQFGLVCPAWGCDMFLDLVGNRVGYTALCQGTLFSPEEALSIGLIDQVVDNSDQLKDATRRVCEEWIRHPGRGPTKALLRGKTRQRWEREREKDLDDFTSLILRAETQQRLGSYLQSLSAAKKK
jgi:Delta3-Delta2-enoyl-CoA isomerase